MPSLMDFYQPISSVPQQFRTGEINVRAGEAAVEGGLQQTRMKRNFETRTLPDLVNREAAKGTFYSGMAGVRADQAKEDYLDRSGDVSRQLQSHLAELARQRIYAALGVSI